MSKTIRLGNRLRYPITIVRLLKQPGDAIKKQEPLLQYSFKWMKTVGDTIRDDTWEEEQTTIADWGSPVDGDLEQWIVREGEVIQRDAPCLVAKEACSHEIQFQGLCAMCGKDMTEVSWAAESQDTSRAPISMVHDQTNLTVSQVQAQRTEQELQRRLLQSRKLSLVVDLDQTIIHACIDPTVGEWQQDPNNPNYESVKDVGSFQLEDGPRGLTKGCWYYIKMRPGLTAFLQHISEMYELHVYTMGTRAYAQAVARIVDPDQKLFGNRVISRDENGNIFAKSLQRLFPVSTNMVVIIDDRSDVWPRNRPNLIKVMPYDFFRGIGDINSSFLPKRQDLLTSSPAATEAVVNGTSLTAADKKENGTSTAGAEKVPVPEELVTTAGGGDASVTKRQVEEQERTLEKQLKDRPLQALQEMQDKEDEEAERASTHSEDGEDTPPSSQPQHRHQVLRDDDNELEFLEQHLTRLHNTYYDEYDRKRSEHNAGSNVDLSSVPDVGETLDTIKSQAMRGVRVVLTGIIPNGMRVEQSEIGQQLISFGAIIMPKVSRHVTHVVMSTLRPFTEKLRQAAKIPTIKIVNQGWLAACFSQWAVVDETPFLYEVDMAKWPRDKGPERDAVSDAEEADGNQDSKRANGRTLKLKAPRLNLVSTSGETRDLDEDSDDEESDGDSDGDEQDVMPDDIEDGQLSPIDGLKTFNWGSVDAELDEFLASGSDDDEDDEDEEATGTEAPTDDEHGTSRKRKFEGEEDDDGVDGGTDSERASTQDESSVPSRRGSQAKRLRRTKSVRGTSSLRNQYVSDADGDGDGNSSLPTPHTGDEQDVALMKKATLLPLDTAEDGMDDFNDAELEAELEAEFMAELEATPVEADDMHPEKG
jgi:RNA polymerase II subunit A-like phosphatase